MAEAKPVVEVNNTAVALASMYEEDAGSGFETADAEAYAIPFLNILQSGSPQVKKSDGAYIKGAEEGMLYNTVTQEVIAEGVAVIPCYYKRSFVKWAPRETGGGFRGEIMPSDPQVTAGKTNADGQLIDNEGNELTDTRTHYVLVLDGNGGYQPAVISMASSQLKKSRQWMSRMQGMKVKRANGELFTPPMFSHQYNVSTAAESNDKGSWFGFKIETGAAVENAALYHAAKSFRDAVSSGEVKEQTRSAGGEEDLPF